MDAKSFLLVVFILMDATRLPRGKIYEFDVRAKVCASPWRTILILLLSKRFC